MSRSTPEPTGAGASPASAIETAGALHSGHGTAAAAVETALRRIADRDPVLRAFVTVDPEGARTVARRVDEAVVAGGGSDAASSRAARPLAGVPVAIKDNVSPDATVVRRLVDAGAIPVGRTTTPELCTWGLTDSAANGVTRNPWDPSRTPGGSSGGSAAAVAAGMVPLAHGNDGAGSLRIPAACCGLITIKAGLGVVPTELPPDNWGGMAEDGPLATTVADLALALSVMTADPSYREVGAASGLRVGATSGGATRVLGRDVPGVRPPWRRAVRDSVGALREGGVDVCDIAMPEPVPAGTLLARWTSGVARAAREENLPLSALERRNRHHALLGRTVYRRGAPGSGTRWDREVETFRARALELFDTAGIDVLMTPALADVPPPATEWHERSWARNVVACARFTPMCVGWNLLGWPAMSVPAGQVGASGGRHLPTAVQLVGRPGSERDLLAVAGELERRHPWRRTAP